MNEDYAGARDRVSLSALKILREYGPDRAVEMYLGAIDALTVAVFTANGGGWSIGLAIDNTQTSPKCDNAA